MVAEQMDELSPPSNSLGTYMVNITGAEFQELYCSLTNNVKLLVPTNTQQSQVTRSIPKTYIYSAPVSLRFIATLTTALLLLMPHLLTWIDLSLHG